MSTDGHQEIISREAELDLIRRAQAGDTAARDRLLLVHERWVHCLARRWWNRCRASFEYDDCFQTAMIGALRSIAMFDCDAGLRWTTYATWWIRQRLGAMREHNSVIRVPRGAYTSKNGVAAQSVIALDAPRRDMKSTWAANLKARCDVFQEVQQREAVELVNEAMKQIPERWQQIVRHRMAGRTLEDISQEYGVSKERIRQLESRAISRMAVYLLKHRTR